MDDAFRTPAKPFKFHTSLDVFCFAEMSFSRKFLNIMAGTELFSGIFLQLSWEKHIFVN